LYNFLYMPKPTIKEKKKPCNLNNPVPVVMGELKPLYRQEAFFLDRSMHWLMLKALKEYTKTFQKQ